MHVGWSLLAVIALTACGSNDSAPNGAGGKSSTGGHGGTGASAGSGASAGTGANGGTGGAAGTSGGTGGSAGAGASAGAGGGAGAPWVDPIAGIGSVELVQGGYYFLEGPAWFSAIGKLRFTDNAARILYELTPPADVAVFRDPDNFANGLGVDQNGLMVVCEQSTRQLTRTLANGTSEVIVDNYQNAKFNSPNDVIVAKDGTIYFTDPAYGGNPTQLGFQGVFRVDPSDTVHLESQDMTAPNGIALSPDGSVLYVDDSEDNYLRRYDIASDGSSSNPTKLADTSATPDGMGVDLQGDLFVSTSAGIEVYLPDGTLHGTIAVAEQPANCTFGGSDHKTLYITARTSLYRVTLPVAGLP
jgi:gluconolactonase